MKNFDFILYHEKGWDALSDKMHVHNDAYEILHVVNGSGYFLIGGTPYPLVSGALYFANTVHLHCSRPENTAEYVRSKITVNATYFDSVMNLLGLSSVVEHIFGEDGGSCVTLSPNLVTEVDRLFRKMADHSSSKKPDANAKITLCLVELLLICHGEKPSCKIEKKAGTNLVSRVLNYINANISGELTIEQIAKDNFVSKYHLCRTFKKTLGVSIMKYILSQRITLAKEQLIHSDASCSDIAMLMGFSSFSYFCRAFKEQEGMTPNQYRKLYKKTPKEQQ